MCACYMCLLLLLLFAVVYMFCLCVVCVLMLFVEAPTRELAVVDGVGAAVLVKGPVGIADDLLGCGQMGSTLTGPLQR